ncbi:MAG: DUF4145 domain-containing protein [Flavobacterium sp.]|nr:MAG: DUF4145 domain-containing protein [Flavobacterium sp.]
MADTRTTWKNPFETTAVPEWTCPTCNKGVLKALRTDFTVIESLSSKEAREHPEWEPDWVSGRFTGLLKCSNKVCADTIIVSGEMSTKLEPDYDDEYEDIGYEYTSVELLTPTYFSPALNIFQIHQDVPNEIWEAIHNSFKLYWYDTASCANKIRVVIELIMDEQKVPNTYIERRKRKIYSLHKRIELFKIKKPDEGDLFMAIKWIGNSGSHKNEYLSKDDLLDAYEILSHVTAKLYETTTKRIKRMTKKINKRKKPIGKNRP